MKNFKFFFNLPMIFLFFSSVSYSIQQLNFLDPDYENDRKFIKKIDEGPVNVLSIDGGGVRGIIPAAFLEKLEQKTQRPVSELFDLTVGTSTGAILSLGLTTPKSGTLNEFRTANEMVDIYKQLSSEIFPSYRFGTYYAGLWIPSLFWWGSEYSEKPLENKLSSVLGSETKLSSLPVPTAVTSVDVEHNTVKLFRSYRANWKDGEDFYIKDVARATSAAPTFFPMKKVNPVNKKDTISLVDGGLAANNPSIIALSEAYNLFGKRQVNLISLGTGNSGTVHQTVEVSYVRRANPTIGMLFDAQSHTVDRTLDDLSQSIPEIKYCRVQITLEENLMSMDCASNVERIYSRAKHCFENDAKSKIEDISNILVGTLNSRNRQGEKE